MTAVPVLAPPAPRSTVPAPTPPAPAPSPTDGRGSALLVLGGAAALASSGLFVTWSGVGAATASFWRCVLALLVLVPLAVRELRRHGAPDRRLVGGSAAAGVLLGVDFLAWTQAVLDSGVGVANVLLNVQVLALPLLAWVAAGVPVRRLLTAAPVLLGGLALAGGLLGGTPDTPAPARGALLGLTAGLAYAGYLFLSREAARRAGGRVFLPVAVATATAAATTGVAGAATTGIDVALPATAWLWLAVLACVGQVAAWVAISRGSAGLAPTTTGTLLLAHPVLSVLVGALLLAERPTGWQVAGCVLVVGAVAGVTRRRRTTRLTLTAGQG